MKRNVGILFIFISLLLLPAHAAFKATEIMYLSYKTYFENASVNNFWVDSNKLYILDSYNIRVLEFSLETGKKTGDYKINRNFGDTLHPQTSFLVYKENVFIMENTRINYYNLKTKQYSDNYYSNVPKGKDENSNLRSMFQISGIDDGKLYVTQLGVSGAVWNNGNWIKPEKVIVEKGQRFQGNVIAEYSHLVEDNTLISHTVNKIKKEKYIGKYWVKIFGASTGGIYLEYGVPLSSEVSVGFIPFDANSIQDRIKLPRINGAPILKKMIFTNNMVYYLMGDKEGVRLFILTRVSSSQTSSGFEKYNYNYDFKDKK